LIFHNFYLLVSSLLNKNSHRTTGKQTAEFNHLILRFARHFLRTDFAVATSFSLSSPRRQTGRLPGAILHRFVSVISCAWFGFIGSQPASRDTGCSSEKPSTGHAARFVR
jgi:hypothetical protein